ncbi:MAG: malto-oligosyltrehalose trehalohydrolase [Chloroflexi bacterium]|nr:malto-oligosyltrehalose trehalohydrolase [Chloroflexota bacterium]
MAYPQQPPLGATILDSGECLFNVWAPNAQRVELALVGRDNRHLPMQPAGSGYHRLVTREAQAGSRYCFRLDGQGEYPDPASRFQPEGVHGPSEVVDERLLRVRQQWYNLPLRDYIFYEIHVGTFTPEGTFEAIIPHLDTLKVLGITAIELMPVAQFPGGRNWGYDGVYPYAAQNTYGGTWGLKTLVKACHERGLAMVLDVVYNHLGPEGNYLGQYGPYFTDRYRSGWGSSLNFDGEYSDEVRRYFIENAIYWLDVFQIDALRLDATHALLDFSAVPVLQELTAAIHDWADCHNRRVYLIAENDRSDVRVLRSIEAGGYGLDAQWLDDLHHCLHVLLTGEQDGYYEDYVGFEQLEKALREGFVFSGDYSPFRKRRHGTSSASIPGHRFVVSTQNHDQVGNRLLGERLSSLVDFEGAKLAAGVVILSPYLPMVFMGEEYREPAPFLYFVSHTDPALVEAIRTGRAEEFKSFDWKTDPPDAFAEETFNRCKLNHDLRRQGEHRTMHEFYKALLHLRKTIPALHNPHRADIQITAYSSERVLFMHRRSDNSEVVVTFNVHTNEPATLLPPLPAGGWRKVFDTLDARWQPEGQPHPTTLPERLDSETPVEVTLPPKSFAVYEKV